MDLKRIFRSGAQCILPVVLIVVAVVLRSVLFPGLRFAPYVPFFPVIAISALYGGASSGLFAIVLTVAANTYYFGSGILPSSVLSIPGGIEGMSLFLASSAIIVGVCTQLLNAKQLITKEAERLRQSELSLESELADRKRAQESLRESEEHFRTLADNIPQLCWMANSDGWIFWYNLRWYEYTGTTPEQMEGWGWQSVHDPEVLPKVIEEWQKSISTGKLFDMIFPIRGADGIFRPFLTRVVPVRDENGKIVRWFGTNTDITEQKKTEEAMFVFSALVESADDAIISKDLNGIIRSWNIGAEKTFGFTAQEAIGKDISFLVPPGHKDEVPDIIRRILRGEHIDSFETHRMRKDGTIIPVALTFSAIRDGSGNIIGVSKIAHDISIRRRAEEERERLIREIERSNRELEQFAYVASHDLQEPLRMVASYLQLLERKYRNKLDDHASNYISIAVDGARRMQKLIEGLLAYSRIARGEANFQQVDTNEVFERAVSNLSSAIQESNATITKDDLPKVTGDETQLAQLFQNLIGNAVKFRKPDLPPEVHVSAKQEGREWIFSVKDNGIGMESQYFERVFLIFQRLHTRDQYPGTGIGLALCKRIVERHHGRMWIESKPYEGTTFFFAIPDGGRNE